MDSAWFARVCGEIFLQDSVFVLGSDPQVVLCNRIKQFEIDIWKLSANGSQQCPRGSLGENIIGGTEVVVRKLNR